MESFLDSPIAACPLAAPEDAQVEHLWPPFGANEQPFGPVEGDTEFARQCSAATQGYEFSDDCAIPRQDGLRDDVQFDPFLASKPEVKDYPEEDPLVVERRHAITVLKQLLEDREYARIPLWIALEHPDLVRRVFGHFKRGVGLAASMQTWRGAEKLQYAPDAPPSKD